MPRTPGILYVVATPIGNLQDLSPRARAVLGEADVVAAEDTRHTGQMLGNFGIVRPLVSLHEHNEAQRATWIITRLKAGENVALVSDAGTPLISDPGYRLLSAARREGIRVCPVPGPSAAIAALSVAGLATDRFAFEGFLPPRPAARRRRLAELEADERTLVFYETGRRIRAVLADMTEVFDASRRGTLAREMTKIYESVYHGSLHELLDLVTSQADARRGELVLVVEGATAGGSKPGEQGLREGLRQLLEKMPLRNAVAVATQLTGERRNRIYRLATEEMKRKK